MAHAKTILRRLLGKKVYFHGRLGLGVQDGLVTRAEAQQATIADKLDAFTNYLVLADLTGGKTLQAAAASLNAKGASVQILDIDGFLKLVAPTDEELAALLRAGPGAAESFNRVLCRIGILHLGCGPARTLSAQSFNGLDLSTFLLGDIAFEKCSFVKATLSGTPFHGTNCDLSWTKCRRVAFQNVASSIFHRAIVSSCSFAASLDHADFSSAGFEGTSFNLRQANGAVAPSTNVCFRSAVLDCGFSMTHFTAPIFEWADLSGSTFSETKLENADFRNSNLRTAALVGCSMTKADFTDADLRQANLADADLTGACFNGADLTGCNLRGAKLDGADLSAAKGYDPTFKVGTIGPALTELDAVAAQAQKIDISFRLHKGKDDEGDEARIVSSALTFGYGMSGAAFSGIARSRRPMTVSDSLLLLANLAGHKKVRFETVEVKGTKSPKAGKALRDLVIQGISEALAQPVPEETELAAATKAWREAGREQNAADRERREAAKKLAEKQKVAEKVKINKDIKKQVGKVTDISSFLNALELRADKQKIDKATRMLKASGFQLYNDINDEYLSGVVKSQTDPDLVYACRLKCDGGYACCTQNLNICGGLRGSICKHLLVLIIGLVKAGELDPSTIDGWIAKSHDTKPQLDKEVMGEIFIRYKGAEAGEVDWRPTETLPEDYYAL